MNEPERKRRLPPVEEPPPGVVKTTKGIYIPSVLHLREAAERVTERERLLCPMIWPDD